MTDKEINARFNKLYDHFNNSGLSSKDQIKYYGHDSNKDRAISYTAREFGISTNRVNKIIGDNK